MCKLSVIVPVYNVEKYIEQCLSSILNQDFEDFEVLCVNDCSTDNSLNKIKNFHDNRIKIINNQTNKGVSFCRNLAIEKAKGDYVIFVDSDDFLSENVFNKLNNILSSYPDLDSICFDYNVFFENKNYQQHYSGCSNYLGKSGYFIIAPENISDFPAYIWNKVFKTKSLKNSGLKFTQGLYFQCVEFNFKFFTKMNKTYYLNETLYNYRVRNKSALTSIADGNPERCRDLFKIFYRIYEYAKQENLLCLYKKEILRLAAMCISTQYIDKFHEEAIKSSYKLLKDIDFPNSFN